MNYSNPILICDENEEFRVLVRDMLTKNGFFHVVEASTSNEAVDFLRGKNEYLVLVHAAMMTKDLSSHLSKQKDFVIFADNAEAETALLAARVGVHHIMSYPFHSRKLINRLAVN